MTVTQTGRRLALVGLLAMVAALLPLSGAFAQTTPDEDGADALNLTGDTNIEFAIRWSQVTYTPISEDAPDNAPTEALLGRNDLFADSLASGALQGVALDGGRPLLLTESDELSQETLDELDRLSGRANADDADDADFTVHILGGVDAISQDVEDALADAGYTINRFEGETRIETAVDIASATDNDTVLVVRAFPSMDSEDETQAFADSLGAGALAATNGWDILFTQSDVLTGNTAAQLEEAGYAQAYVVGGTAAISDDVLAEIEGLVDAVERVGGDTRFETAIELNDLREGDLGDVALLVDGQADNAWADGFPAANISGLNNYPLVLSNQGELPEPTEIYLGGFDQADTTFAAHFTNVALVCGNTADTEVCVDALNVIRGDDSATEDDVNEFPPAEEPVEPTPTGVTDRPELVQAAVVSTTTATAATASNPVGTVVRYTFDEIVTGGNPAAGSFFVTSANNTRYTDGTSAQVDPNDTTSVLVRFPSLNSTSLANNLTVATVASSAVVGAGGSNDTNIEGDASLNPSQAALAAGVTAAPDLVSVGNFRNNPDTPSTTLADFTFDENARNTGSGTYGIVTTNGAETTCAYVSGNGSTTLVVSCTQIAATGPLTADNVARGYVATNTVRDGESTPAASDNANPLQAANVGALSSDPALVSVEFRAASDTRDQALFTFSEPVLVGPGSAAAFNVYQSGGASTEQDGQGTPVRSTVNDRQVLVDFPNDYLNTAVGASVDDGAVVEATGSSPAANEQDEVAVAPLGGAALTAGRTTGPDLTGVTQSVAATDPFTGNPSSILTVYTFDENLASVAAGNNFYLYQADGTQITCTNAQLGTASNSGANTVRCTTYTTSSGAASATAVNNAVVGTVTYSAVTGGGGVTDVNPIGADVVVDAQA